MTTWCFKWPILCISYKIKSRHFYWTEGNQVSCWFSSCSQVRVISRNRRVWPESGYRLIRTPIGDICPIKWEGLGGFSGFSRLWNEEWLHLGEKSTIMSEYTTSRSAMEQPINFADLLVLLTSQHEPGAMWEPIKNARPAKPAHLDVTHLNLAPDTSSPSNPWLKQTFSEPLFSRLVWYKANYSILCRLYVHILQTSQWTL